MSGSEDIVRQFSGQIPGMATGQNAVAKVYVDDELAIRDGDIQVVAGSAAAAQNAIDQHEIASVAHPATAITYSGVVDAGTVEEAIDKSSDRVEYFIANSGNSVAEIVNARDGQPQLNDRLNIFNAQLAEIALYAVNYKLPAETDWSIAINAAILDAAIKKKKIILPSGNIGFAQTIHVKKGTTIETPISSFSNFDAVDKNGTSLVYTGTGDMLVFDNAAINVRLSGFCLIGNADTTCGIRMPLSSGGLYNCVFDNVSVYYVPHGYGLYANSTWSNQFYGLTIRECGVARRLIDCNAISFYSAVCEWNELDMSAEYCTAIGEYSPTSEGNGGRIECTIPSDFMVWTDRGKTIADYKGNYRVFGSQLNISGNGYIEEILSGKAFDLELAASCKIDGMYIELLTSNCDYVVDRQDGSGYFQMTNCTFIGEPNIAFINLQGNTMNAMVFNNTGSLAGGLPLTKPTFVKTVDRNFNSILAEFNKPANMDINGGTTIFSNGTESFVDLAGVYTDSEIGNRWRFANNNGYLFVKKRIDDGSFKTVFSADEDSVYFNGSIQVGSGWETALSLGNGWLWFDATGTLRVKVTKPTSDLDGTVAGTQT